MLGSGSWTAPVHLTPYGLPDILGYLAPFLIMLYTSDFRYNSESCHIQKYSDDTDVVGFVSSGQDGEYRDLVLTAIRLYRSGCYRFNSLYSAILFIYCVVLHIIYLV